MAVEAIICAGGGQRFSTEEKIFGPARLNLCHLTYRASATKFSASPLFSFLIYSVPFNQTSNYRVKEFVNQQHPE